MSVYLHPMVIHNIKDNIMWSELSVDVKQLLGNSHMEYENAILMYSLENNLRYKGNLVQFIEKDEKRYYERMIKYCNNQMMLFPYHLSDIYIKGLRLTPFLYYKKMLQDVMNSDKNYDSIPNFTAIDILLLLGIGRNQFIDCMNQCRKNKKQSSYGALSHLLPREPLLKSYQDWWDVRVGFVTCEDVTNLPPLPKAVLDALIDAREPAIQPDDGDAVVALYKRGLVYFDIPVRDKDIFVVPPLEGFVMNRLQGDNIENLLYSIFATLDPSLTVANLSRNVLALDLQTVKNGISLLNRLGLAVRVTPTTKQGMDGLPSPRIDVQPSLLEDDETFFSSKHSSDLREVISPTEEEASVALDLLNLTLDQDPGLDVGEKSPLCELAQNKGQADNQFSMGKKIAIIFDSSLTAFLMMGNLSQGLKTHAITMFETGKLPWESLQDFLRLLEQVDIEACGNEDIQVYAKRSQALKNTLFSLVALLEPLSITGLDLLKCESFSPLNKHTCQRILEKYECVIYISPLSQSICPVLNMDVPTFGPSIPEMHTPWFTLFLCHLLNDGPISLLLVRGTMLTSLPDFLSPYSFVQIQTWDHDSLIVPVDTALIDINEALGLYPVMIRPYPLLDKFKSPALDSFSFTNTDQNDNFNENQSPRVESSGLANSLIKYVAFPLNNFHQNNPPANEEVFHPTHKLCSLKYFKHSFGYLTYFKLQNLPQRYTKKLHISSHLKLKSVDAIIPIHKLFADASTPVDDDRHIALDEPGERWHFYQSYTGTPLSDLELNAEVLEKIKTHNLLHQNNLLQLKAADKEMSDCFLQFIHICQKFGEEGNVPDCSSKFQYTFPGKEEGKHKDFSYPRKNLLFYGDKIFLWKP